MKRIIRRLIRDSFVPVRVAGFEEFYYQSCSSQKKRVRGKPEFMAQEVYEEFIALRFQVPMAVVGPGLRQIFPVLAAKILRNSNSFSLSEVQFYQISAILGKYHDVHCVGTPEFMAPEVYEEQYNMQESCIWQKASSYKVKDPEIREFIEKCLATASCRLPERNSLMICIFNQRLKSELLTSNHPLLKRVLITVEGIVRLRSSQIRSL
ncbi:hypothetical protein ACET3Z_027227 [Daucus carota]